MKNCRNKLKNLLWRNEEVLDQYHIGKHLFRRSKEQFYEQQCIKSSLNKLKFIISLFGSIFVFSQLNLEIELLVDENEELQRKIEKLALEKKRSSLTTTR